MKQNRIEARMIIKYMVQCITKRLNMYSCAGPPRGGSAGAHEFKQVESCFLNNNSSIHFCCTDSSLLMAQ